MPYMHRFPPPQGLYDPRHEHDACGVAFVATLTGEASHDIVVKALTALRNLDHRGAAGAEANSGDGAGILMQVPDAFLRAVTAEAGITLPAAGTYAVGTAFLPGDAEQVAKSRSRIEEIALEEGFDGEPVVVAIDGGWAIEVSRTLLEKALCDIGFDVRDILIQRADLITDLTHRGDLLLTLCSILHFSNLFGYCVAFGFQRFDITRDFFTHDLAQLLS